jgi:hypothetical protein
VAGEAVVATYNFECPNCYVVEVDASIHVGVRRYEPCPGCGYLSERLYTAPQTQEDRLRFYRNQYGTRWSYAIGAEMPESRSERRRIERERGIMFDDQLTPKERTMVEYAEHVRTGGERLPNERINPTEVENKPLLHYWDHKPDLGRRIGSQEELRKFLER